MPSYPPLPLRHKRQIAAMFHKLSLLEISLLALAKERRAVEQRIAEICRKIDSLERRL